MINKTTSLLLLSLLCVSFVALLPSSKADATTGLVGYWPMNEGTGSVIYDYSNNMNNGLAINASWAAGKIGSAIAFNGANSYINTTSFASSGSQLSIAMWINPVSVAGSKELLYSVPDSNGYYHIFIDGSLYTGGLTFGYYAAGFQTLQFQAGLTNGTWQHIGLVADYATLSVTLYVNGNFVEALSMSSNAIAPITSKVKFIGSYGGTTNWFNGVIDDVRIYNRSLSASDISQLYTLYNPISPTATPNPSTTPPSGILPATLNVQPFWQYIYAGNMLGWLQSIYLWSFIQLDILAGAVCMLFLVPLYLRTKSLLLVCVVWILLGSFFISAFPALSGLAVVFLVLGVAGVLYRLVRPS